jgi:glycosyltransferase involved in cell wall biosynthesis
MRRVLHVIETMAPREGGPPRVVAGLLTAQRSIGIDAQVLSGDTRVLSQHLRYWQAHVDGFSADSVHTLTAGDGLAARALALLRWLRQHLSAYDLIHVHQLWRLVPTLTADACRRRRVPYLIAPHTSLSNWALSQKRAKKTVARELLWNRIFRGAAGFHALNELEAAEIRESVGPNGPPVFVVPNGVFLPEFSGAPVGECPAASLGRFTPADGERPYILFLARLHTMKGPDLLLEAFASVARERSELQLVFAGADFGMLQQLRQRAAELRLSERVHFLGLVSGSDRLWLLQRAVCLCQPSRDEGFSLSILEAMACGRPVVISDRCKFPEVAQQGAGIIVPLSVADIAAALLLYAGQPASRAADGRSARQLVERSYTWDSVSRQTDRMYTQILDRAALAAAVADGRR